MKFGASSKLTLTLIILAIPTSICFAQSTKLSRTDIEKHLADLADAVTRPEWSDKKGFREIDRSRWSYFSKSLPSNVKIIIGAPVEFPPVFLASLDDDRKSIAYIVGANSPPWPAFVKGTAALEDIQIKANFLSRTKSTEVAVTVNTVDRSGKPVSGCEVWFAPYLFDDEDHKLRFDKFSTPTSQNIPSGKWTVWTQLNGKASSKTPIELGDDGNPKRELDLLVP